MSELKFYICKHCGNIIAFAKASGVPVVCCGEKMEELVPNTTDAAVEKHVPVVSVEDGKVVVTVGSVAHPMTEAHYIEWIAVQTKNGNQRKALTPSDEPKAEFPLLPGDEVIQTLAYCNLHGLWKK
ncbi:desulfoferrodoxin [bacterium]|nr:desulfoferrodoxin [bacterium]